MWERHCRSLHGFQRRYSVTPTSLCGHSPDHNVSITTKEIGREIAGRVAMHLRPRIMIETTGVVPAGIWGIPLRRTVMVMTGVATSPVVSFATAATIRAPIGCTLFDSNV